ncbi:MAG: hypothetical protein PWP34_508 [Desulfuromonadales bacterium]|jgi:hypothetical protein|nr:hypothetical protein [Desulfuromonadales bacterium]
MPKEEVFFWQRHAVAERLTQDILADCILRCEPLARLQQRMLIEASCRLFDWVDYLQVPGSTLLRQKLQFCGFVPRAAAGEDAFFHPGAVLPAVVPNAAVRAVALRVDNVANFLQANNLVAIIEGSPFSPMRRARITFNGKTELLVMERRGYAGYVPQMRSHPYLQDYFTALELWQGRPRTGDDEELLWQETFRLADLLVERLGADCAAQVVCLAERLYWQRRNRAGQLQKSRQDVLGLGWGNHDHHTFRSSRRHFARLVSLFSTLGFESRERFYAGDEAGWGAQVMENRAAGLSLFLDVDLAPQEVQTDFSRERLPERDFLGTVGLWCALHGDSIFGAGMHHLAARCDFTRLIADLAPRGVAYMAPFSDFTWLRQAFSKAERWSVDEARLEKLLAAKLVTRRQADKFQAEGAVGSHLENIQRGEGYKGFNKKNVSAIIRKTDPRM